MAKSILDIVIKTSKAGGADKDTLRGLTSLKTGIMEAAAVAGTLVAAGYTIKVAFDATVGTMVAYADQVRSIAQVSGLSAEESSKLVQITDDLKISQEELLKVMQKNGDQYDYTVSGLAAMSDEYLALSSAEEKAEYMQERFGKSWGTFVELMEQGSKKIQAAGDGINEALILDQKALDSAREYEKQVDNLSDSWEALKISAGRSGLPIVVDLLSKANAEIEEENGHLIQGEKAWRGLLGPIGAVWNAIDFFTNSTDESIESSRAADAARLEGLASLYETTTAYSDMGVAVETMADAAAAASERNREFLGLLGNVQSTQEGYEQTLSDLTQERMDLEREKQDLIAQGYSDQSQQIQDVNLKIEENAAKTTQAADQFELDNKRILLGYLERKLTADGTLDDRELLWLTEKGVAWGVYHKTAVEETRALMEEANALLMQIQDRTVTLTVQAQYDLYGDEARIAGGGARRATGTHGWETVPAGYPGDSFPVWMTSGEQFAVIPAGGSGGNVATPSAASGGGIHVTVNINSMINTADRERVKAEMLPVILDGIRSAQAQGML